MITPYFEPGFNEDIKAWVASHWPKSASLSCANESHRWAKWLLENFADLDVEVHEGFALVDGDPDCSEGHTWLVVEGCVFDPTYEQFNGDFVEYDTHQYWDSDELVEYLEEYGIKVTPRVGDSFNP